MMSDMFGIRDYAPLVLVISLFHCPRAMLGVGDLRTFGAEFFAYIFSKIQILQKDVQGVMY